MFLGMAAGVGKTYRMLQEGYSEAENGRDVVIGYLEAHGRRETEELARDLEIVPRRRVVYRDTPVEEMDLPAILDEAGRSHAVRRLAAEEVVDDQVDQLDADEGGDDPAEPIDPQITT